MSEKFESLFGKLNELCEQFNELDKSEMTQGKAVLLLRLEDEEVTMQLTGSTNRDDALVIIKTLADALQEFTQRL